MMQLINTNLGCLFEGLNIEPENNIIDVNYLVNDMDKENINFINLTLNKLIDKIYNDFTAGTVHNMKQVENKYSSLIKTLNDNIHIDKIRISIKGNYLYLYYYNIQLCYISLGNKKLKENEYGEGFIIFNLIGKITCPGKTALCKKYCYNNCCQYKRALKSKIRNTIFSLLDVFEPAINKMLFNFSRYNKIYFRIHEDGDFYSMEYFTKWLNIAKQNSNVVFMGYTKSIFLLDRINDINSTYNNFVLRYSIMEDTKKEIIDKVIKNNIPCYVTLGNKPYKICSEKEQKNIEILEQQIKGLNITCQKSCKYCKKCYKLDVNRIFTTMH